MLCSLAFNDLCMLQWYDADARRDVNEMQVMGMQSGLQL